MIAEHRDVYRVAPKANTFVVVTVVAFQQFHMRRRVMPRVQSRFRQVRVLSSLGVIHIVVRDNVPASRSSHHDILVAAPHDIVLDEIVGRAKINADEVSPTAWIRVRCLVDIRISELS